MTRDKFNHLLRTASDTLTICRKRLDEGYISEAQVSALLVIATLQSLTIQAILGLEEDHEGGDV